MAQHYENGSYGSVNPTAEVSSGAPNAAYAQTPSWAPSPSTGGYPAVPPAPTPAPTVPAATYGPAGSIGPTVANGPATNAPVTTNAPTATSAPVTTNGNGFTPAHSLSTAAAPRSAGSAAAPDAVATIGGRIIGAVSQILLGKPDVVRMAVIGMLAEGHLLIEDVPGTGKTNLAKALAKSVSSSVSRVQFTPDLMPSDVTGVSIYDRQTSSFEFKPGPVFANIVVADEINRASPKTQSSLLEAMEERQVTVDGTTYPLARPFLVLATQNPVEMEGTYPLPEAQRDRFIARTAIGYPDAATEIAMLAGREQSDPLDDMVPVTDAATVSTLIAAVNAVHLAPELRQYIVEIVRGTRVLPEVRLGASPRAVLHLARCAKASAALDGRGFVLPDDVQRLAAPVLAHRLLLTVEAHAARRSAEDIVGLLLSRVRVPRGAHG